MTIFWKNQSIILIRILLILLGLCFCLILLGLLFFWWIQPRYVFYTGDKQQWETIELTFPNRRMGDGIAFMVDWDTSSATSEEVKTFIDRHFNGNFSMFYDEFNKNIEILQFRDGEQKRLPVLPEGGGVDFGLITVPDQVYSDETRITIRMNESLQAKRIPGDIILWKYMK